MSIEHPHSLITAPGDPTERVWRYMDFAKFVSLISRRELYFCNLEVLASNDPHEGLLSQPNYRHRQWTTVADLTDEEYKMIFFEEMEGEKQRIQFESQRNSREYWARRRFYDRRTLLINCWHLNKFESAAMWMQYASGGQGIAITSNFDRLIACLAGAPQRVFAGLVKYPDWNREPVNNTFVLPFSKRASFAHEREIRLVYWDEKVQEPINQLCSKLAQHTFDHLYRRISTEINWDMIAGACAAIKYKDGIYIPVDIELLVDEIYISPTSPAWFLDVVIATCEKFNLQKPLIRSDLLSSPIR
jgi:hypothetical protein